jgi:ABC-type transporter Mla maintaining outer membrane lipid asymmetry ATPase subunit MlaF
MSFSPSSSCLSGPEAGEASPRIVPAGRPLISFRGVHKAFGEKKVLAGVDLDIYPGETMVILGRSGSGKTVLTSMLVGLNNPDTGSIKVEGRLPFSGVGAV